MTKTKTASRAPKFKATHVIKLDKGETIDVMLCEDEDGVGGPAYSREEFETTTSADYEYDDHGFWLFQGEAFNGSVEAKKKTQREHDVRIAKEMDEFHLLDMVKTSLLSPALYHLQRLANKCYYWTLSIHYPLFSKNHFFENAIGFCCDGFLLYQFLPLDDFKKFKILWLEEPTDKNGGGSKRWLPLDGKKVGDELTYEELETFMLTGPHCHLGISVQHPPWDIESTPNPRPDAQPEQAGEELPRRRMPAQRPFRRPAQRLQHARQGSHERPAVPNALQQADLRGEND